MRFTILFFVLIFMVFTKVAYDVAFARYDPPAGESRLSARQEQRRCLKFSAGANLLCGYLYEGGREALVVVVPGYSAGADDYLQQIDSLLAYGWGVFAFDPTGSCASGGDSAVGFAQTLCDLNAALGWLEAQDCFGYEKLLLLGHSRGGYAACCALELPHKVAGVVSISGVNSAMEGVLSPLVARLGPLAWAGYPLIWLYQSSLFDADTLHASAARALGRSEVPVLLIHGNGDCVIPMDAFSVVAHRNEIQNDRVEYLICTENGQNGHSNLMFEADGTANARLMAAINAFFARAVGSTQEREKENENSSIDPGLQAG